MLELFGATPGVTGMAITPAKAMKCTPVRAAVQAIAETIGQLPVHAYSRSASGAKERDPDHPAHALLHDAANEWTPATKLREEITRDALLDKGGFAFINRVEGKPYELIRLAPSCVDVSVHATTYEPVYKLTENGRTREIDRRDILHIPSPSLTGSTLVQDAREAIGLALILEAHAARLFANGARPSGILSHKGTLTPALFAKIKDAWQVAHGGQNSGGTAILEGDVSWEALTLNSVDAQFLELRQLQVLEIARVFRVPPIFIGEYGRATWANSEEQGKQLLTYTLMPWIKRWEGEIALKLFTPDERKTRFAEFLTDDLARADLLKRMEAYSKAIAARILNPNEARAAENRAPYDGGDVFANPNVQSGGASE